MDIDLVMERNIQLFIRLLGLPALPVSHAMGWRKASHEIYLDYRSGRLHLSLCIPDAGLDRGLLREGLARLHPARFAGIPQRLYRLQRGMVLSCSLPVGSAAEFWLMLYRRQATFLEALCVPR